MFTIYQLVQDFAAIHSMSPFNPQSSAEITVLPRGCHVQPRCLLQTPHLKNVMARCCTYVRAIPPWQKIQLINPKFFVCLPGSNEMIYKTDLFYIWLVVSTPLKNISQLGWLFPIFWKIENAQIQMKLQCVMKSVFGNAIMVWWNHYSLISF